MKAQEVKTIKLPMSVLGLDVSADMQHLYAACMDGGVYQVDVKSGAYRQLYKHESFASGVSLVRRTNQLISAGYDGAVHWHDLTANRPIRKINAHRFWSWQSALSPDGKLFASVTGQYLAGGPKYEPAPQTEPSVKVFSTESGKTVHELSHVPSVQSVAFSPDSRCLAAGNLMGEIRVWEVATGKILAKWTTSSFTSWGIIKSHCYQGGIFSLAFSPDSQCIVACGMGPMRDPMAGNGKQTWQKFSWQKDGAPRIDEIHDGEHGGGHPETIAFHPSKAYFVMAGRLAQGKWNTGFFDASSGALVHSFDTKCRLTKAIFSQDGSHLLLGGTVGQSKAKDGKYADIGRIFVHAVS